MNCSDVQAILSDFFDGELSESKQREVRAHIDSCADCQDQLVGFERLSTMAFDLKTPESPPADWRSVERELDRFHFAETRTSKRFEHLYRNPLVVTAAAVVVVAVALILVIASTLSNRDDHDHHDHLAVDFDRYLEQFKTDPIAAQQALANQYRSTSVDIEAAAGQLGYRPAVADGLPQGIELVSTHVMDMPCCKCVTCICQRDDGSYFAVFEHDDEQPVWFGSRPAISAKCGDQRCELRAIDDDLVVSWHAGGKHLTIIGARDLREATELVSHFENRTNQPPD